MRLRDYIEKNRLLWAAVFLFAGLCHGSMLFGNTVGIDTADLILLQSGFYESWLITGRQGLVLLKGLMGNRLYNPYLTGAYTLVFLTLSCILWTWLFARISGRESRAAAAAFSLLLNASAILTEQLYFRLQAAEISLSFCLTAAALYLVCRGRELYLGGRGRAACLYLSCAVLLNLVTFSVYQAMAALFIFGSAACFFLFCFFGGSGAGAEKEGKELWGFIGVYAGVFFISFLCDQAVTELFFSGSSYLSSQMRWGSRPVGECLRDILWHMECVMLGGQVYRTVLMLLGLAGIGVRMIGGQIYYHNNFGAFCVLTCIAVGRPLGRRRGRGLVPALLGVAGCLLAPFYMTFLCGGEQVMRSQLVLPFALAFLAYVLLLFFPLGGRGRGEGAAAAGIPRRSAWPGKLSACCAAALCVLTVYQQLQYTLLLDYTDRVRFESDARAASLMMEKINGLEDGECSYPVAFVGKRQAELNKSCLRGETIGISFFEIDAEFGVFGTQRILGFMHALGADYTPSDEGQFAEAVEYSAEMSSWPREGSVMLHEGVIVVKLAGD